MPDKQPPVIILYLSDFVELFLGDAHCKPIPKELASGIEKIEGYKDCCHIQKEQCNDYRAEKPIFYKLVNPILWNRNRWIEQGIYWNQQKVYSQVERVKRRIAEANIKIVTSAVVKQLMIEGPGAEVIAKQLVYKNKLQNIYALGVKKLISKEEELF